MRKPAADCQRVLSRVYKRVTLVLWKGYSSFPSRCTWTSALCASTPPPLAELAQLLANQAGGGALHLQKIPASSGRTSELHCLTQGPCPHPSIPRQCCYSHTTQIILSLQPTMLVHINIICNICGHLQFVMSSSDMRFKKASFHSIFISYTTSCQLSA